MTQVANNTVLVVRHGIGRGRIDRYMEPVLSALRARPRTSGAVRVHETGDPAPSLDGVAAVVFWLADPLRERYPRCYAEAVAIAGEARACGIRIVNPPESLSNSVKSRQSRLWREAGFETPRWLRFEDAAELPPLAREIGFPVMVRADEAHGQESMRVARSERDLASILGAGPRLPGSVAPLWDLREGFRARDPRSAYARFHHKKRLYVLGDRVRTEHIFFSENAIVSARTCTFARFRRLPGVLHGLSRVRARDRLTVREDVAYWRRGQEHEALMRKAAEVLGFAFAAIDYSERADGGVVLWEANPHPHLPPLARIRLPRQRLGRERLASYHRAVRDFLFELIDPNPDRGGAADV